MVLGKIKYTQVGKEKLYYIKGELTKDGPGIGEGRYIFSMEPNGHWGSNLQKVKSKIKWTFLMKRDI